MVEKKSDDIELLFNYDTITERDKKVVLEVINYIENFRKGVPIELVKEELKQKWKIEEVPTMKIEDSVWGKLTKGTKLEKAYGMVGYKTVTKDGLPYRIPHVSYGADLDDWNEIVNILANKLKDIK